MIFTPSSLQLLEFIDIIVSQRIVLLHAFIHFWIEFVSFSFFKATRNISLMIMIFTPSSLQCKSSNDGIDFINGIMEWFYEKFNCIVYVWIFIWSMNFLLMYFKIPYDFTILRSEFVLDFPCRVKIAILTTLSPTTHRILVLVKGDRRMVSQVSPTTQILVLVKGDRRMRF